MNIISIIGIILITAVISVMIKNYLPEYSIVINIATGLTIFAIILSKFSPVLTQINALLNYSKIPNEYCTILFKCLGICLISQFAADACRDAKETSLAFKVELAGKVTVVVTSIPLFEKIMQTALKLIGG